MVLLSPCADESLLSLFVRLARVNGYTDFRSFIERSFPGKPCVSFINSEMGLPAFCRNPNFAYGDAFSALERLTSVRRPDAWFQPISKLAATDFSPSEKT